MDGGFFVAVREGVIKHELGYVFSLYNNILE